MAKRPFFGFLICLIVAVTLLVGCGSAQDTTTPAAATTPATSATTAATATSPAAQTQAPATTAAPAATAATPEFTLIYAHPAPQTQPVVQTHYAYMDYIEEQTGGRVIFERYPGGTLCSGGETADFLKKGAVDLSSILAHRAPTNFPLHYLPVQGINSMDDTLVTKLGEYLNVENEETAAILRQEAEEQNTIFLGARFWPQVGYSGIGAQKEFTTLEELKGEKIASIGAEPAFEALGITIVTMTNTDIYESLARGVVSGVTFSLDGFVTLDFYEHLECYMNIPACDVQGAQGTVALNLDTWNSLPSDIQDIFRTGVDEVIYPMLAESGETGNTTNIQALEDAGLTVGTLSAADGDMLLQLRNDLRKVDYIDLCTKAGKADEAQIIIAACDEYIAKLLAGE